MAKLTDIVKFLDDYLEIEEIEDGAWNGLQFEGKSEVSKIGFAVDSGLDAFIQSKERGVDLLIVHHGHFWKNTNPSVKGFSKERLGFLFENQISLYTAHLPLDRHKEIGNNAQLLKLLDAKIVGEFDLEEGKNVSWVGELKTPQSAQEIAEKLNERLNTKCIVLPFGTKQIKTIAVCTGGGGYSVHGKAQEAKVDLYITGDPIEVYSWDKDAKFNVIFAGHYATETLGVKALMPVLEKEFGVETIFIDIPTGL
ncbi:Nif3-like dinuclear metal center hexameric protein [Candidatus Daviesbacteria bacterium]|nr:Nif3-like dinuclear metal center hexameric protein [Candidatus Daviesbacteria bacterium]